MFFFFFFGMYVMLPLGYDGEEERLGSVLRQLTVENG
mgnify:FL=1